MALDAATGAASLYAAYAPIVTGVTVDYAPLFATEYDTYAAGGVVPGAVNTGGTAALLEAFVAGVVSGPTVIDDFADALAQYWATVAIAPGSPAHGGSSVVSVTNDAASQTAAFKSAIEATITAADTPPYFQSLYANIESIGLAAVTWTVTELISGTPTAFQESIS